MYIRSVSILLLYNSKGEILLQHRTKDAPYYPDYWGFFGGGIEDGESPEEALVREAKEELQIDIESPKLFKRYEIEEEKGIYERFLYLLPTDIPLDKLKQQQLEGDGIGFFSISEAKQLKFNPHTRFIFDEIGEFLNRSDIQSPNVT